MARSPSPRSSHSPPTAPVPLPVLPLARVKETSACARPIASVCLAVDHQRPSQSDSHRGNHSASKRRRISRRSSKPFPPPHPSPHPHPSSPHTPSTDIHPTDSSSSSLPCPPPQNPASISVKSAPAHDNPFRPHFGRPTLNPRGNRDSSLTVVTEIIDLLLDVACVVQEICPKPLKSQTDHAVLADNTNVNDLAPTKLSSQLESQQATSRVRLEFVSPVEEKLMASLTYTLPSLAGPSIEEPKVVGSTPQGKPADETTTPAPPRVGDLELEFRSPRETFASKFDDRDSTDELGPELVRLSHLMQTKKCESSVDRAHVVNKVQAELLVQETQASLAAEETHILARLKEIANIKRAEKAQAVIPRRRETDRRRSSKRSRSTSRTREPGPSEPTGPTSSRPRRKSKSSRRVIIISDDEDDDNDRDEDFLEIPETISSEDKGDSSIEFVPEPEKDDEVVEVVHAANLDDDGFLEIPPKQELSTDAPVPENFSAATTPSGDVGNPSEAVQSPVGIFPGETESSSDGGTVTSPLPQLKVSSPRKGDLGPPNTTIESGLKADAGSMTQNGKTCG
ncbi:unnamed protein product [Chondrus crispus]|uniref:Uncharacterized protein n=1 Tax=Chondrus crispus TaxID=2769 RepID=R7QP52_CHOCR|nr:unnamed protein product [Chondrus crispus]CDF39538.1 unnamed protein product [Chondrus crispus]|eukprot:XP_005713450.1 unnamed protein product [Chondrus crispus]